MKRRRERQRGNERVSESGPPPLWLESTVNVFVSSHSNYQLNIFPLVLQSSLDQLHLVFEPVDGIQESHLESLQMADHQALLSRPDAGVPRLVHLYGARCHYRRNHIKNVQHILVSRAISRKKR